MSTIILVIESIFLILTSALVVIVFKPRKKGDSKNHIYNDRRITLMRVGKNTDEKEVCFKKKTKLKYGRKYYFCITGVKNSYRTDSIILKQGANYFGRDSKYADYVIGDRHISRKHFLINVNGQQMIILDCNSTNGTYLNGEKLSSFPRELKAGDSIRVGRTEFICR